MNYFYARFKNFFLNPTLLLPPFLLIIYNKFFRINNNSNWIDRKVNYNFIFNLFKEKKVLNGPFKGMQYPSLNSTGSALFPKLLGSYERELHFEIEAMFNKKFYKIIDIGCAEGYYAIGFANIFLDAEIHVFDINQKALEMCEKMALLNKISNIHYNTICTNEWICENNLNNSLIISDCEGFELNLFTDKATVSHLKNTTLIIETHDFVDLYISEKIKNCFSESHFIKSIYSIDDFKKVKMYNYPELSSADVTTKFSILNEGRPYNMEWLILTPKNL